MLLHAVQFYWLAVESCRRALEPYTQVPAGEQPPWQSNCGGSRHAALQAA